MSGCTGPAPRPKETAQAPQAPARPATPAYDPSRVKALIQKLTSHRRTLYSVSRNEYAYYMGGVLTATFRPGDGRLRVRAEGAPASAECSYDSEGRLLAPKGTPSCDRLLATLESSLDAP
ncbi:MAG TPA: hypothetical protein ENK48_02735 [Gammaproteobacteria bacterium]|nr:hypothetical protein [Gammaproteobacteria bacterium]